MRIQRRLGQVLLSFCFIPFMPILLIAAADPTTTTLERSAVEEKYKWDLSKMYASQEDWESHYKKIESMISDFAAKSGKVGDSAESLLDALKLRDQINIQLEKVAGFTSLVSVATITN